MSMDVWSERSKDAKLVLVCRQIGLDYTWLTALRDCDQSTPTRVACLQGWVGLPNQLSQFRDKLTISDNFG